MAALKMYEVVGVGEEKLVGEVIKLICHGQESRLVSVLRRAMLN